MDVLGILQVFANAGGMYGLMLFAVLAIVVYVLKTQNKNNTNNIDKLCGKIDTLVEIMVEDKTNAKNIAANITEMNVDIKDIKKMVTEVNVRTTYCPNVKAMIEREQK